MITEYQESKDFCGRSYGLKTKKAQWSFRELACECRI